MPPVGAAIAAIGSALGGALAAVSAFAAGSFLGAILVNTAVSLGLSLIARALGPKPKINQRGIQTAVTTTGGTTPQAFILGRTATAGHHVCPPMSHDDGKTPNGFLTYVIELSDIPGIALSRVILNDGYSELGSPAHPDYGFPLLGQRQGSKDHAWIRFHDGTQTAADPMLVARYADFPDRPWSAAHIGTGTAYAILTFRYNREVYNSLPQVRFELDGIALYDPRFDSTVGGSGPQRWNAPATWTRSANPAVMIYNILRGIQLPSGDIWGGEVPAEDLPLDNWFAAMNACDAPIGGRPSFEAGLEVKLEMEPADVIEELAKTCLGQISEMGGVFRMRVGAPAAPVQFITDEDIVISAPQELDPFPGLAASTNAIFSDYPEPESLWLARAAPPVLNPAWEAEDGGRRLPTSLNFPACGTLSQVAQLMAAYAKDARRFRVHRLVLPPEAFLLEPLDSIAWTSVRNGYAAKIFEVVEILDQPGTINQELLLRERDPGDYSWSASDDLPTPLSGTGLAPRTPQVIEGWSVAAVTLRDALGIARRPAVRLSWTGAAAEDARAVRFELRLAATAELVASGLADRSAGSALVSEGLLPATAYQARGRYVADRPTAWSAWLSVTTAEAFFSEADFEGGIRGLFEDAGLSAPEIVTSLPASGAFQGQLVFLTTDNKLYRWTGSAWTAAVPAVDITGQILGAQIADGVISTAKFAQGLRPVEIAATLPTTGNFAGRMVFLTSDGKLYRHIGAPAGAAGFTASVPAVDVSGQLTDAQIAAIDAAKLTGQITAPQIADSAITDAKIAGLAASKVTGQLTDAQIEAVSAAKMTGQIVASQIANAAITVAKFASNIRPVEIVSSLPTSGNFKGRTVFLTSDDRIYRHTGAPSGAAGFTASVPAIDISGQLTDAQIAALSAAKLTGQITAPQIADSAITDAKIAGLAASKVTGQLTSAQIAELDATKLTGQIVAAQIANGAITDAKIAGMAASKVTGQLTDAQIASLAATKLAGQITETQISDQAITTPKIAAGAITASEIAAGAILAEKIAANAVTAVKITAGAITTAKIATGAVEAGQIAAGAILADKLAANAVTADKITANAVTTAKIAAGAVTASEIAANAITAAKISAGAVEAAKIAAGAVLAEKIAAGAVTAGKIAANAVTATEIAAGAITTVKLAAGAVTANEIAANAIVGDKIAANAVTSAKISAGAVTANEIATNAITADKVAANAITVGKVAAGAISAREIAANAITATELAIGDFTNICPNPNFADGTAHSWSSFSGGWAVLEGDTVTDLPTAPSRFIARAPRGNTGANDARASSMFADCREGDRFYLAFEAVRVGSVASTALRLRARRQTRASGAGSSSNLLTVTPTALWQRYEAFWTATADFDGVMLEVRRDANTDTGDIYLTNFVLRRVTDGVLIADGAITAAKVSASAITSDKLAANAVTASEIASNAVTAAKINAGAVEAAKIAAGAVLAEKIAAGAVTAGKIAANAVTATEIAANAVTSVKIAAGAVTANEIAAGSIVADKIATNAVTTAKISAGAVTADEIATNAITADKVAANAITVGKIAAGAVRAQEVAAGAILASKLAIGDMSNAYPDYDMEDQAFYATNGPTFSRSNSTNALIGNRELRLNGIGEAYTQWCSIDGAAELRVRGLVRNGSSTNAANRVPSLHIELGSFNSGTVTPTRRELVQTRTSTSYTNAEIDVSATVAEDRFRFVLERTGSATDSYVAMGGLRVRKRMTGELIVDGAISADKIAANAITAAKIAAGAVTADKIVANTITGGLLATSGIITEVAQINDGLITNAKIANAAITSAKIGDAQITSAKIANLSVDTLKIAGQAITTEKLAAMAASELRSVTDISATTTSSSFSNVASLSFGAATAEGLLMLFFVGQLSGSILGAEAEISIENNGVPIPGATGVFEAGRVSGVPIVLNGIHPSETTSSRTRRVRWRRTSGSGSLSITGSFYVVEMKR